ncbi:MAG: hypothetical protein KatS3mg087_0632 [Patescibacteria group bacterium]|nr:MAG: hypothetical protein KatS3mg087_0632 [Patescibacteria group bacterium]
MKVSIAFRANDDFLQEHVVKKVMVFLFAGAIALSPVRAIAQTYSQQAQRYSQQASFLNLFYSFMAQKYPNRQISVNETSENLIHQGWYYCSAIGRGISDRELIREFILKNRDLSTDEFSYASTVKAAIDVAAVHAFCPQHRKI